MTMFGIKMHHESKNFKTEIFKIPFLDSVLTDKV